MNIAQEIVNATKFLDLLSKDSGLPLEYTLVGSAGYLPTEKYHDVDFLMRLTKHSKLLRLDLVPILTAWGFTDCAEDSKGEYPKENFITMRKKNLNLILCDDYDFYQKFVAAFNVCKALHLEKKYDRILVHALVRDDMTLYAAKLKASPWLDATVTIPQDQKLVVKNNLLIENPGIDAFGRRQLWGAQA